jgi:hypothetical protein
MSPDGTAYDGNPDLAREYRDRIISLMKRVDLVF